MLTDCDNFDPDVRATGAFDLCAAILKQQDPFDESTEKKIVQMWIKHLGEESVQVKGNAVRCIKDAAPKVREANVLEIADSLGK